MSRKSMQSTRSTNLRLINPGKTFIMPVNPNFASLVKMKRKILMLTNPGLTEHKQTSKRFKFERFFQESIPLAN